MRYPLQIGLTCAWLTLAYGGLGEKNNVSTFAWLCCALGTAGIVISSFIYRVTVSPLGIGIRTWRKKTFIAWGMIQLLQIERYKLSLKGDQDPSLEVPSSLPGYDEILKAVRMNRPDLYKPLILREFRRTVPDVGIIFLGILIIFIGAIFLVGPDNGTTMLLIFLSFIFLEFFILLILFLRFRVSVELKETELIIHYPLIKKRIPLTDVMGIVVGTGLQTRSAGIVNLGKVKEGDTVLYDSLIDWWEASKSQP